MSVEINGTTYAGERALLGMGEPSWERESPPGVRMGGMGWSLAKSQQEEAVPAAFAGLGRMSALPLVSAL